MSDETYAVAAIISIVLAAVGVWSSIRRRQLMRKLMRSIDKQQLTNLGSEASHKTNSTCPAVATQDPAEHGSQHQNARILRTPPSVAEALIRVTQELDTARRLLGEIYSIGLWSKSDDSSDNRRKRNGLREKDWAVSGALRAITELRSYQPDSPESLNKLEDEMRALVAAVEPLPDIVTDTMGEDGVLDSAIGHISEKVSELLTMASDLAEENRRVSAEDLQ